MPQRPSSLSRNGPCDESDRTSSKLVFYPSQRRVVSALRCPYSWERSGKLTKSQMGLQCDIILKQKIAVFGVLDFYLFLSSERFPKLFSSLHIINIMFEARRFVNSFLNNENK